MWGAFMKMPHSKDLEERVLGCMINRGELAQDGVDTLSKETFYDHKHQALFSSIKDLVNKDRSVDVAILLEEQRKRNGSFSTDDFHYLTDLAQKAGVSPFYEEYVRSLKDLALRRKGIEICHSLIPQLEQGKAETEQSIDEAVRGLTGLEQTNASMRSIQEIIDGEKIIEELSERQAYYQEHKRRKLPENVINTGISEIDNTLGGLYPTRVYVLGARPGVGKTSLALNISLYAASRGHGVSFFSLEMGKVELINRYVSSHSDKKLLDIQMGCLTEGDFASVKKAFRTIRKLPINIDEKSFTFPEIRREVRRLKREKDIHLVVVDYLQLIATTGSDGNKNRNYEVSEISRGIKLLAKEFNVTVIALSQLSRESEKRKGKDPQLSDLRDSGSIEQDADVVMLLSKLSDKFKLNISKNRHGYTGVIDLYFEGSTVKFKDQYGKL
jgi:replicative DNA helicase